MSKEICELVMAFFRVLIISSLVGSDPVELKTRSAFVMIDPWLDRDRHE